MHSGIDFCSVDTWCCFRIQTKTQSSIIAVLEHSLGVCLIQRKPSMERLRVISRELPHSSSGVWDPHRGVSLTLANAKAPPEKAGPPSSHSALTFDCLSLPASNLFTPLKSPNTGTYIDSLPNQSPLQIKQVYRRENDDLNEREDYRCRVIYLNMLHTPHSLSLSLFQSRGGWTDRHLTLMSSIN